MALTKIDLSTLKGMIKFANRWPNQGAPRDDFFSRFAHSRMASRSTAEYGLSGVRRLLSIAIGLGALTIEASGRIKKGPKAQTILDS